MTYYQVAIRKKGDESDKNVTFFWNVSLDDIGQEVIIPIENHRQINFKGHVIQPEEIATYRIIETEEKAVDVLNKEKKKKGYLGKAGTFLAEKSLYLHHDEWMVMNAGKNVTSLLQKKFVHGYSGVNLNNLNNSLKLTEEVDSMAQRPQFTKSELKKMIINVMYELKYGTMQGRTWGIDSIIPNWINEYYKTGLATAEKQLAYEAVQELKTAGLIAKDSTQYEDVFQVLTEKGKAIAEKKENPDVYALRLEEVIKNPELLAVVQSSFNEDDYEIAIFRAFRLVEEKVRATAHLDAKDIGTDLMTKAFSPTSGKLTIPMCAVTAEQDGVHQLFRGAIALFKNPSSHRTVDYSNRQVVIQTIAFAELLLDILSTATLKP